MSFPIWIFALAVLIMAVGLFLVRAIPGIRAYFVYRGQRLITCPETQQPEAVDVAAEEAAIGAFLSQPTLRLKECSRWPERQNCGQTCLSQIEIGPAKCLVWNVVSDWYEGKACSLCHKPIGPLHHLDHAPAVLGPDSKTAEWREFRAEHLPGVFSRYQPVCWNCHVTETFRRMHPELVVDRPFEPRRMM